MPTHDDSRRVMKPYEHVNSPGRPSATLGDTQIRQAIRRVMPELMEHHLDALVPNCRLVIDVMLQPSERVPMEECMEILSCTRYWSAMGRGVRKFSDTRMLILLIKGLSGLVDEVRAWREGGKFPSGQQAVAVQEFGWWPGWDK